VCLPAADDAGHTQRMVALLIDGLRYGAAAPQRIITPAATTAETTAGTSADSPEVRRPPRRSRPRRVAGDERGIRREAARMRAYLQRDTSP
jgi:hypothetical protein